MISWSRSMWIRRSLSSKETRRIALYIAGRFTACMTARKVVERLLAYADIEEVRPGRMIWYESSAEERRERSYQSRIGGDPSQWKPIANALLVPTAAQSAKQLIAGSPAGAGRGLNRRLRRTFGPGQWKWHRAVYPQRDGVGGCGEFEGGDPRGSKRGSRFLGATGRSSDRVDRVKARIQPVGKAPVGSNA